MPETGGRKAGTPNKRTEMLGDVLADADCDVPTKLVQLLTQLSPDKQANVLLGLLPYLYPKRSAIELDQNDHQLFPENRKQAQVAFPDVGMTDFGAYLHIARMSTEEKLAYAKNLFEKSQMLDRYDKEFEEDEKRYANLQQK